MANPFDRDWRNAGSAQPDDGFGGCGDYMDSAGAFCGDVDYDGGGNRFVALCRPCVDYYDPNDDA